MKINQLHIYPIKIRRRNEYQSVTIKRLYPEYVHHLGLAKLFTSEYL